MVFMHFRLRRTGETDQEWGFESTELSPAIGDKIYLCVADPDDDDDREIVECRIKDREIVFAFHNDGFDEIFLEVATDGEIDPRHVADSEAWPADEYNERLADLERALARIKKGEPPE